MLRAPLAGCASQITHKTSLVITLLMLVPVQDNLPRFRMLLHPQVNLRLPGLGILLDQLGKVGVTSL